jgi:GTP pyrophosphokinase
VLDRDGVRRRRGPGDRRAAHDAIEDVEPVELAREEVGRFGPEVLRIVEACTDSDAHPKPPWHDRKEAYLAHLPEADAAILLVSASDKLHHARTIVTDPRDD